jgi:hypothetical protein
MEFIYYLQKNVFLFIHLLKKKINGVCLIQKKLLKTNYLNFLICFCWLLEEKNK